MKKSVTKIVAITLALSIALTGCGSQSSEDKTVATSESGTAETSAFTISVMQELFSDQAPDLTNNEWVAELEKQENVELNINFVPTLTYVDKITTYIASESLPMIFSANNSVLKNSNLLMALDSDGFWNLDDYLKDYPNLYNFVGETTWENSKINGKIYGIPRLRVLPRNGAIIRQDWLDNLGLEAPETFDELTSVLKAFTEDDPDGNGADDTYGLVTAYQGVGNRGWNGFQTIATAFGAPNGWQYISGQGMVPDFGTEEYMTALQYIKNLYDNGYMNIDFAEIDGTKRNEYFDSGAYGVTFCTLDDISNREKGVQGVNADAKLNVMPALHAEGSDPLINATSGFNGIIMFTKYGNDAIKTEDDLKKILAFYDSLCTDEMQNLINYGIEGKHYQVTDGKKTLITNADGKTALSVDIGDIGQQILPTAAYVRRDDDTETLNNLYTAFEDRQKYIVNDDSIGLKSDTYNSMSGTLDAVMMDASIRYVVGTLDEDGYWSAYESWKSQGGNDVIKEFTEQYETYKAGK